MSRAVLDACVLYPPSLRDLFMWLAVVNAFSPRWTQLIQEEWTRNVAADNPTLSVSSLAQTCLRMETIVPDGLVSGYEFCIPDLELPDPDDRHVLAAAIISAGTHIVTYNTRDFPDHLLMSYSVRAVHPDYFLSALFDGNNDLFLRAVKLHRASLKKPPKDVREYILSLRKIRFNELPIRLEKKIGVF